MAQRKKRVFTAEEKAEAVKLAEEAGNISKVARSLDIHPNVLGKWVKQARIRLLSIDVHARFGSVDFATNRLMDSRGPRGNGSSGSVSARSG